MPDDALRFRIARVEVNLAALLVGPVRAVFGGIERVHVQRFSCCWD